MTAEGVRSNAAVAGTAGPDPHLRRRAGRDLLLLDLGRPHREHPVLVRRRAQQAVARGRARPLRLPLALPPLARLVHHGASSRGRSAPAAASAGSRCSSAAPRRGSCRAQVIGSRGTTTISGPTIRARLGLRDTWMRFTRVSTSARAAATAQAAAWTSPRIALWTLRPAPASVDGSFDPRADARHRLVLERRIDGRWKRAGTIRTAAHGRYRTAVQATRRLPGPGRRGGRAAGQGALRLSAARRCRAGRPGDADRRGHRPVERRGQQARERPPRPPAARCSPSPANQEPRPAL